MPVYSFQERFIPLLIDGSKKQTIRKKRRGQAKPGDILYLYFGMRTKYCKKIMEADCREVKEIIIHKNGVVTVGGRKLNKYEKDTLAFNDGFRLSNYPRHDGSFDLMLRWWKQTHELPFKGDIIYW